MAVDPTISSCEIRVVDEVATLSVLPTSMWEKRAGITPQMRPALDRWWEIHADLARALAEVRDREDVRVIVLTGAQEGTFAYNIFDPRERDALAPVTLADGTEVPFPFVHGWNFRNFKGVIMHHEISAECEKPIIAKVNGNAFGGGLSMMLACDIIVARDDAIMCDYHMALEEWPADLAPDISAFVGALPPAMAVVPGDGGIAWAPQYLSPARAKEFLLLGRPYTAKDFERMGVINYAVPVERLDGLVDDLVKRLIARPPESIAMTKRLANRTVVQHLNLTLDAAAYAEWLELPSLGGVAERWTEPRYKKK